MGSNQRNIIRGLPHLFKEQLPDGLFPWILPAGIVEFLQYLLLFFFGYDLYLRQFYCRIPYYRGYDFIKITDKSPDSVYCEKPGTVFEG